jgi:hypothetical protein
MPFFVAVFILTFMVFGFVLIAYLFLFSIILGAAVYIINWIRMQFLPPAKPKEPPKPSSGRIIDTDDWHKL